MFCSYVHIKLNYIVFLKYLELAAGIVWNIANFIGAPRVLALGAFGCNIYLYAHKRRYTAS